MRKVISIIFITTLLSSCTKEKNWVISDCLGNDISSYRGSEDDVKSYCQTNSTPSCAWSYRRQ